MFAYFHNLKPNAPTIPKPYRKQKNIFPIFNLKHMKTKISFAILGLLLNIATLSAQSINLIGIIDGIGNNIAQIEAINNLNQQITSLNSFTDSLNNALNKAIYINALVDKSDITAINNQLANLQKQEDSLNALLNNENLSQNTINSIQSQINNLNSTQNTIQQSLSNTQSVKDSLNIVAVKLLAIRDRNAFINNLIIDNLSDPNNINPITIGLALGQLAYLQKEVSKALNINLNITTSIEDDLLNQTGTSSLRVYPNPVSNYFTINNAVNVKSVTLTSIAGETIEVQSIQNQYDISTLSKGTYIVNINFGNQYITERLLLK
jgi:hypothetical protein